jgi:hypothetical protein
MRIVFRTRWKLRPAGSLENLLSPDGFYENLVFPPHYLLLTWERAMGNESEI